MQEVVENPQQKNHNAAEEHHTLKGLISCRCLAFNFSASITYGLHFSETEWPSGTTTS